MKVLTEKELKTMLKNKEITYAQFIEEMKPEAQEPPDSEHKHLDALRAIKEVLIRTEGNREKRDTHLLVILNNYRDDILHVLKMIVDRLEKEIPIKLELPQKELEPLKKWRFTPSRDDNGRIEHIDAEEI